jgi:Domain of unknown function (DUF4214)
MPNFSRVIAQAYLRILDRLPDAAGLTSYNEAMNRGMTEAQMRESLIRSREYAEKNPDVATAAARPASGTWPSAAGTSRSSRPR